MNKPEDTMANRNLTCGNCLATIETAKTNGEHVRCRECNGYLEIVDCQPSTLDLIDRGLAPELDSTQDE